MPPTVIFLGALLIGASVAMGPLVASRLEKLPLSIDRTQVADGTARTQVADGTAGTRVLDRCSIDTPRARVLAADVQQRRRLVAVHPADADVVTVQAGTALGVDHYLVDGSSRPARDVCARQTLAATIDRVTLTRTDAAPTGASSIQYRDDGAAVDVARRSGRTYALPFGFESPGSYFDVTTRSSVPLVDRGRTRIDGRTVAQLRATVADTDLSTVQDDSRTVLTRPASWFGDLPGVDPRRPLTATLHHRAVHDLFVDTETGVLVDERTRIVEEYRFTAESAGGSSDLEDFRLTNLSTTLIGDRASRIDGADAARSRARPVRLTSTILPITLGTIGGVAVVGGVAAAVVTTRRRTDTGAPAAPDDPTVAERS